MRNWLSCRMCLRIFCAISKRLCRWQKKRGGTDGKLPTAMARWLQPPTQMLNCEVLSYTVWTQSDKLTIYPVAHSQALCSSPLRYKSWRFYHKVFCSLPQLAGGTWIRSVVSWLRKEVQQPWTWLPWFKTEVSSSMTCLLQPLWKCFTQIESAKHRVHSLSAKSLH